MCVQEVREPRVEDLDKGAIPAVTTRDPSTALSS